MEQTFREKHALILRLCHWLNVPLLLLMIWSGLLIYWANPAYVKIPNDIGPFQIHHRLAQGMAWHFTIMWPLVINALIYFAYLSFSNGWRDLLPQRRSLPDAIRYTLHDLHLTKSSPDWNGKFNPAQRLAYFSAIVMGVLGVLTGLAIYKPVKLFFLKDMFGGYPAARFIHFICMVGLSLFILIHLVQVIRAGWNNFRSMVAGYEVE